MSALDALLPDDGPATVVLAWVLTYALHSTALLGGVWILTRIAAGLSDRVRDGLWKLALVGGVLSATVQVGLGVRPLGGRLLLAAPVAEPALEQGPTTERRDGQERGSPLEEAVRAVRPAVPSTRVPTSDPARTPDPAPTGFPVHLVEVEPESERSALPSSESRAALHAVARTSSGAVPLEVRGSTFVLAAWVAGLTLGGLLFALALVRLRRALLRRRPLAEGRAADLFAELKRRSGRGRRVRLSTSSELAVPVTFGVLFPEVCVPERSLTDLADDEQEAMLAHELAHAVRRDPAWQLVAQLFVTVFFFQPLNRLAKRRLSDLAEFLSDDWAVAHTGRELSLASCLTEVARWVVAGRRPLPVPAMAGGSRLGSRVGRLLDRERERPNVAGATVRGLLTGSLTLAVFASAAPGIAAVPGDAKPSKPTGSDSVSPVRVADAPRTPRHGEAPPVEALDAPSPEDELEALRGVTDPLLRATSQALDSLDREIDELVRETESLQAAISELPDASRFDSILATIEGRLERLRSQREALARELPRLTELLANEGSDPEEPPVNSNPRRVSR